MEAPAPACPWRHRTEPLDSISRVSRSDMSRLEGQRPSASQPNPAPSFCFIPDICLSLLDPLMAGRVDVGASGRRWFPQVGHMGQTPLAPPPLRRSEPEDSAVRGGIGRRSRLKE